MRTRTSAVRTMTLGAVRQVLRPACFESGVKILGSHRTRSRNDASCNHHAVHNQSAATSHCPAHLYKAGVRGRNVSRLITLLGTLSDSKDATRQG